MTDIADRDYQVERGVIREAIVGCLDLTHAERIVALAMLELVSRQRFRNEGLLVCWPSEAWLAAYTGISARHVRRARQKLQQLGAIQVAHPGGNGPGSTTHYAFDLGRAANVAAEAKERAKQATQLRAHAEQEGGRQGPPSQEPESEKRSAPEAEGGHGSPPMGDKTSSYGGQNEQLRGTRESPEPLERTLRENPLMEPSDARSSPNAPSAHADTAAAGMADAEREGSKPALQREGLRDREREAEIERVARAVAGMRGRRA